MENQHTLITGYRDLKPADIELMNKIKAKGVELQALLVLVNTHISVQQSATGELEGEAQSAERARLNDATPARWAALGRTHLQEGLMALTRAVAQPTSF